MPRPKKKPVQQRRAEAPTPAYLVPAPSPPEAPPPTPPKPTRVVAAESPSKSVLLSAQREARRVAASKKKEALIFVKAAEQRYAVQGRLFDAAMRRCDRMKLSAVNCFSRWKTIQLATDKLYRQGATSSTTKQTSKFCVPRWQSKTQKSRASSASCPSLGVQSGRGVGGAPRGCALVSD